jgi:hypothetical protein
MVGDTTLKACYIRSTALAVALLLGAAAAPGNQIAGFVLTGHITAISGADALSVDGHGYTIKAGSAAAAVVRKLSNGAFVDVVLSGPPGTAASQIINIVPHPGQ